MGCKWGNNVSYWIASVAIKNCTHPTFFNYIFKFSILAKTLMIRLVFVLFTQVTKQTKLLLIFCPLCKLQMVPMFTYQQIWQKKVSVISFTNTIRIKSWKDIDQAVMNSSVCICDMIWGMSQMSLMLFLRYWQKECSNSFVLYCI